MTTTDYINNKIKNIDNKIKESKEISTKEILCLLSSSLLIAFSIPFIISCVPTTISTISLGLSLFLTSKFIKKKSTNRYRKIRS